MASCKCYRWFVCDHIELKIRTVILCVLISHQTTVLGVTSKEIINSTNLIQLQANGWNLAESTPKECAQPSECEPSLGFLDEGLEVHEGVWLERGSTFRYSLDTLTTKFCRINEASISIKYYAEHATAYFAPCNSDICYIDPPSKDPLTWGTINLKIETTNLEMIILKGVVLKNGFFIFDEITITHDGVEEDCTSTTPTEVSTENTDPTTTPDYTDTTELEETVTVSTQKSSTVSATTTTQLSTSPTSDITSITSPTEETEGTEDTESTETSTDTTSESNTETSTDITSESSTETSTDTVTSESSTEIPTDTTSESSTEIPTDTTFESSTETTTPTQEETTTIFSTEGPIFPTGSSSTTSFSTSSFSVPPSNTVTSPIPLTSTSSFPSITTSATPATDENGGGLSLKETLLYIVLPASVVVGLLGSICFFGCRGFRLAALKGQGTATGGASTRGALNEGGDINSQSKRSEANSQKVLVPNSSSYTVPTVQNISSNFAPQQPMHFSTTPYHTSAITHPSSYLTPTVPNVPAPLPKSPVVLDIPQDSDRGSNRSSFNSRESGRSLLYTGDYEGESSKYLPRMRRKLD